MSGSVESFVSTLSSYRGRNVFNPYADICETYDKSNASDIRRKNLIAILNSISNFDVHDIWIGRDLGYRGGRRTGLALTDEENLKSASQVWNVNLSQATEGVGIQERTAGNIWKLAKHLDRRIFMWNVFPFHPHEENTPFSNRCHTSMERDIGLDLLMRLIEILQPERLVAIGNDAYNCSIRIFCQSYVEKVRHPSYGGEKDFMRQMHELYKMP